MSAARRLSPRRLVPWVRLAVLGVLAVLLVRSAGSCSIVTLPAPGGVAPLFDYAPAQRGLVQGFADQAPRAGDAVLYRAGGRAGGEVRLGRLVAVAGDEVEIDLERERVRRHDGGAWFPVPRELLARLELPPGAVLVAAESPQLARQAAILQADELLARVVVALPF